ncbi:NAD(P)-binding oxidoreductase [Streptomyces longwoodensis]|uniref:NAD(P)-dependent oxidoreductase n=1 Tax=Streptomyces longwoodensis TaxID=68231 RepID=UPI00339E94CA
MRELAQNAGQFRRPVQRSAAAARSIRTVSRRTAGHRLAGAVHRAVAASPRLVSRPNATGSRRGTAAVVAAMQATGVRRLVVVSAAPIATGPSPGQPHPPRHDPGDGFFMRHLGSRLARTLFAAHDADLALTEDIVRASGLDWTISRPPQLTDEPLTGHYRTAYGRNIRGGTKVARADVAHHMLRVLDEPDSIGQTVGIARPGPRR